MYNDWLALINCAVSSPAVGTEVPENLLLPYSNRLLTSMKSTFLGISSPMQICHNGKDRRAYRSAPHSFPGKIPGENAENALLTAYCRQFSDMTTAGFPHVPCKCLPSIS